MNAPARVRVACPAKVNLFLEIAGRRPDGYHEIDTVFLAVDLFDGLVAWEVPTPGPSLTVEGNDAVPAGPANLVHAAAELFFARFAPGRGAALRLTKRIPDRAGLGGGSSDAAGTLLALRRLFRPDLDPAELHAAAAALGSDVPFFLAGGAARGAGRGDRTAPLPVPPPAWIVLVFPKFSLGTPEVYRHVVVPPEEERRSPDALLADLAEGRIGTALFNRLEEAATRLEPRCAAVRRRIAGRLAEGEPLLMSGSGSAYFVVTDGMRRAATLAADLNRGGELRALAVRTTAGAPADPTA